MNDATLTRLATNTLWTAIRHNRWRGNTSRRSLSNHTGTAGKYKSLNTATIPRAPSMNDTIQQGHGHAIAAIIPTNDRAGTRTTYLTLQHTTYLLTLTQHPTSAREDWTDAIRHTPPNLTPYSWARDGRPNTSGERVWYLCKTWDPYLTPAVYTILHALAAASTFPNLIEDHEVNLSSREPVAART